MLGSNHSGILKCQRERGNKSTLEESGINHDESKTWRTCYVTCTLSIHVLPITTASLFLSYFQHTCQPCQQHTSQINRKYTHACKQAAISASILSPDWHEWSTVSLIQPELSPEAIFQSSQKKGLAGRPEPLSVELDRWNRHYENGSVLVSLI